MTEVPLDRTPPGARVQIKGLQNAPQHNGKVGTIQDYNCDTERYIVNLDNGAAVSCQPENLTQIVEVEIVGVQSSPELNGQTGTITRFDATKGRYEVYLKTKKIVSLKPSNALIPPKTCVNVVGLVSTPQYNGQWAQILSVDSVNLLYTVQLEGMDEGRPLQVRLRLENVRV
eukprot:NODE_1624_length_923_cov_372.840961_g1136_i0.p1 GENE.NODE_1624_length_923_cov_372.840961_g1136_i0~~NODE_1624_length_923_cov_372.840961_g1136_i0.p1  ORF type:complete len:190 (+),score=62.88 NODE_1624_length_923_cov_372.840961_g1136_i0:56-571(+)